MNLPPESRIHFNPRWSEVQLALFSVAVPKHLSDTEVNRNLKLYIQSKYCQLIKESEERGGNPYRLVNDFLISGNYGLMQPGPFRNSEELADFIIECDPFLEAYYNKDEVAESEDYISEKMAIEDHQTVSLEYIVRLLSEYY